MTTPRLGILAEEPPPGAAGPQPPAAWNTAQLPWRSGSTARQGQLAAQPYEGQSMRQQRNQGSSCLWGQMRRESDLPARMHSWRAEPAPTPHPSMHRLALCQRQEQQQQQQQQEPQEQQQQQDCSPSQLRSPSLASSTWLRLPTLCSATTGSQRPQRASAWAGACATCCPRHPWPVARCRPTEMCSRARPALARPPGWLGLPKSHWQHVCRSWA